MPVTTTSSYRLDGPQAWLRLVIAVALGTVGSIGMWAVIVALPIVQTDFGVARADASLPYTTTMIGFALGNGIIGRYVDRLGITIPVIASALILSVGFVLAANAANIWQFAIIQGMIGLGTSATFGPLMASISHWFKRRRGIAVAAAASGNYLAGAIWPVFIQQGIAVEGWRTTYLVIAVLCSAVMIPLSLFLRGAPPVDEEPHSSGVHGLTGHGPAHSGFSPGMLQFLLIVAGISCCVAMSMPQVHVVAYCVDLGYGPAAGAEMLSIMLATGVVSRLASGFIADYIGGVKTVLLGSALQCLALLFYLPFDGLTSLYIVSFMFGLSQGGIVPSYAIVVREYLPAREAGQRVGLVVMSTIIGMALGGWMSGLVYDLTGSYQMAFVNGIAWNILNISIMLLILWRTTRQSRLGTPLAA